MKILIVSDAWLPQVNGVVSTLKITTDILINMGHQVEMITPQLFKTIPCPTYPEIPLALFPRRKIAQLIEAFKPDAVHIATEGPLGLSARGYCMRKQIQFTTSFHTKFPEYVEARFGIPAHFTYYLVRWFHRNSARVMVTTESMRRELLQRGFQNDLALWSRGVDTVLFRPQNKDFLSYPRPISLYVGRVAVEKNLEKFLALNIAGTKLIVGDGPQRAELQARYPQAVFTGTQTGESLSRYYAAADVFVFPSCTDTFGLVMLEALASGVPVAGYPVPGPIDVIGEHREVGAVNEDLKVAIEQALHCDPKACREYAMQFSWQSRVNQFLDNLAPVRPGTRSFSSFKLHIRRPCKSY